MTKKRTIAVIDYEQKGQVRIRIKLNRNRDPELYKMIAEADNRSAIARQLIYEGWKIKNAK